MPRYRMGGRDGDGDVLVDGDTADAEDEKGRRMSRYGDSDYDDMFYELDKFLKSHKPSELLKLVQEAVEWWEEEADE